MKTNIVPTNRPISNQALSDRIRNAVETSGFSPGELRRHLANNRASARLFGVSPDAWYLKGGKALLTRYRARHSADLDLRVDAHSVGQAANGSTGTRPTRTGRR